jgi:hypothetical protein
MSMENEPGPVPAALADEAKPALDATADAAQAGVDSVAQASSAASQSAAEMARDVGERGASAYAQVSSDTAKAFEQARGRLQQIGVPGLEMGQAMFDSFRTGADQLSSRMSFGLGNSAQAWAEFNAKAVEAWRTNAEATIAHWQALAGVTSWSEMIALNTAHTRKQIEAMVAQTRELAEVAGRITREGMQSVKPSS